MPGRNLSQKHADRRDFLKTRKLPDDLQFFAAARDRARKRLPLGTATGRPLHPASSEGIAGQRQHAEYDPEMLSLKPPRFSAAMRRRPFVLSADRHENSCFQDFAQESRSSESPPLTRWRTGGLQQGAFVIGRVGGFVIMNQAGGAKISRVMCFRGGRRRRES